MRKPRLIFSRLPAAALLVSLAACDTGVDGGGSPDAGIDCATVTVDTSATTVQTSIFGPSCATFRACHQGTAISAGGLSLDSQEISALQLINQKSCLFPERKMVVPGSPDESYMMVILGHIAGPLSATIGTMPLRSPLLAGTKRCQVAGWIAELPNVGTEDVRKCPVD